VYDHYYWDRLAEAYAAVSELGAGSWGHGLVGYRMIEGEWTTRERGVVQQVAPWLQIEVIPEEQSEPIERLSERVIDACSAVASRFGFEHGPAVMVSALAAESNVPWMPGRHGYCIDKHPYEKICIPHYSLSDHDDLEHVIQHEYAHVVALNLSQGRCPMWLDEAVAMVAGGGVERRAWRLLSAGVAPWRDPLELDLAFRRNREDDAEREDVWLAYQQSAVIGFYLASLEGERTLSSLLRGLANNSFWSDLLLRLKGQSEVDEALREVYGIGEDELFVKSREWLVGGGSGV
jgi:hypothetical protein